MTSNKRLEGRVRGEGRAGKGRNNFEKKPNESRAKKLERKAWSPETQNRAQNHVHKNSTKYLPQQSTEAFCCFPVKTKNLVSLETNRS